LRKIKKQTGWEAPIEGGCPEGAGADTPYPKAVWIGIRSERIQYYSPESLGTGQFHLLF